MRQSCWDTLASSLLRQLGSFENDFLSWLAFMFVPKPVMFELWFKAKHWNNCHYLHTLRVNQEVTAVGNTTILRRKHLGIYFKSITDPKKNIRSLRTRLRDVKHFHSRCVVHWTIPWTWAPPELPPMLLCRCPWSPKFKWNLVSWMA